jgi:hypothetical protein
MSSARQDEGEGAEAGGSEDEGEGPPGPRSDAIDKDSRGAKLRGTTAANVDVIPGPPVSLPKKPEGPMEAAHALVTSFATARIGFDTFSFFAIRYELQERHRRMFVSFMSLALLIDYFLALMVIALVMYLLFGGAYAVLRGLDVATQTDHIIRVVIHNIYDAL